MDAPIVHIVDDDEPTRVAMRRLISAEGLEARIYASAGEFLERFTPDAPGCIVLDVRLPGLSGLDLQARLAKREDLLPIIFLTGHAEVPDSVRAIQGGAVDFLVKPIDGKVLLAAVHRALEQNREDRAARARRQEILAKYDRLTDREKEVFEHLVRGQLNKQVAADLNISERTIKQHRARIYTKLDTDSMAGLVLIAVDLGIGPTVKGRSKDR
ncbi:MAG TPA: response regulator [Vicinamibacterales bacterium]|nr:response regulator [Vicinamibacterales bacterium]